MATIFKLGQTYKPKDTERTREIGMNGQYMVVIQENSDDKKYPSQLRENYTVTKSLGK